MQGRQHRSSTRRWVTCRPSAAAEPGPLVDRARGASNGRFTFHDPGGPYGPTKGAKRIVAVDVTGLPVGALVVPASTHENGTTELMLEHLIEQGVAGRR